jgi:site-specific DNA-methyltransferase (adenine-specific)/modification methylase
MTTQVQIGNATLILGDCREILPTLPKVDACVTDPPYGINENSAKNATRGQLASPRDYGSYNWDTAPPDKATFDAIRSQSDWQVIWGGNYFELPPSSCWLVWDKLNGENDFADCELAWTNSPKAVRRIRHLWNGMIRLGNEERFHPTQKPLRVVKWTIEQIPGQAHTILDPYMGSGTTGVACAQMGRAFIGIEIDPRYFEIACRRIEAAQKQPDLFLPPARVMAAEQIGLELPA